MDKIKDSGSFDCGSIPHGGTQKGSALPNPFIMFLYIWNEDADYAEDVDDI